MIRLENVTKNYGATAAVERLTFGVEEGEVCILIGPSGCGKTTTLRMVNRLIEPTSGEIYINGKDHRSLRVEDLRRSIGYAIQGVGLFPHMTVAANIAVVPRLLGWSKSRIARQVEVLLHLVGLDYSVYGAKYPSQLSGGEAQRVGVARALAADPPVLLMDEPFGAVDPLTREHLQRQFLEIQRRLKKTVILVTHDLDEAIRLGDRIALMQAGKLVQHDTPEKILSHPADSFVRNFIGADRALKRISRLLVKEYVKPAAGAVGVETAKGRMPHKPGRRTWLVDADGRLIGWKENPSRNSKTTHPPVIHLGETGEISLGPDATLRDALSRMLGLGFDSMPVVDSHNRLLGELSLYDIEMATGPASSVDSSGDVPDEA